MEVQAVKCVDIKTLPHLIAWLCSVQSVLAKYEAVLTDHDLVLPAPVQQSLRMLGTNAGLGRFITLHSSMQLCPVEVVDALTGVLTAAFISSSPLFSSWE